MRRANMILRRLAGVGAFLWLCSCTSSSNYTAQYAEHAEQYSDELRSALRDFETGAISQDELNARLDRAGKELARADAETKQHADEDAKAAAAKNSPAAGKSATQSVPVPASKAEQP